MAESKRVVPPVIKKILQADIQITKKVVITANRFRDLSKFKTHFKGLEISCHGIPWFAFWICFSWLFNNPSMVQTQVNILIGLTLDIIFVAVLKAYTRRKRPQANTDDALGQIGPDVFSFPSGHASRAAFVTYFFIHLSPISCVYVPFLVLWCTAVCSSRILMNRHYILDVVAGICLGLFTGLLVSLLYVEDDTAKWFMNYLSDDKLDGGEYHV